MPDFPVPGFGSILATAFIHMMLPAAKSFANPCLPAFWTTSYDAWAYLFTLLAVLLMQQIDWQIKASIGGVGILGCTCNLSMAKAQKAVAAASCLARSGPVR